MDRMQSGYHEPVLAAETVDLLVTGPGVYVDGTLGGGGHSLLILKALERGGWLSSSLLVGIDQDPDALRVAGSRLDAYSGIGFMAVSGNFSALASIVAAAAATRGIAPEVRGILLDLGVSSWQLDRPEKGFSYLQSGPLDMRMGPAAPMSAADIINGAEVKELASIFFRYGEEPRSRAIAKAIVARREQSGPFETTGELAAIIRRTASGRDHVLKMLARVFQALRIAVNAELDVLGEALADGLRVLGEGGRIAVISYHSLEDRIVKQFFAAQATADWGPKGVGLREPLRPAAVRQLTRKPLLAGAGEIAANPRSRSARLRVVEKLAGGGGA